MKIQTILVVLSVVLITAACGGQASQPAALPVEQQEAVSLPETAPVETAQAEPAAVEPQLEEPQTEAQPAADATDLIDFGVPENLFRLKVPASWAPVTDTTTLENTQVDTMTSPDGNAFVQVMTNRVGYALDNVLKGQVTLDYMKRLYGKDLRVASDVTLKDGREKLEWWSEENKTSGTTFFDMDKKHLYFFTVGYRDAFEGDYAPLLTDVVDSFSY